MRWLWIVVIAISAATWGTGLNSLTADGNGSLTSVNPTWRPDPSDSAEVPFTTPWDDPCDDPDNDDPHCDPPEKSGGGSSVNFGRN
jgi:hypothetical protein